MSQLGFIELQAHAGQVNSLAASHAPSSRGSGEQATQAGLHDQRHLLLILGDQLKRQGLQGVSGQQGGGFTHVHVHRGFAAAQHIVVHTGHVVMHQGISVNQLHSTGGP